MTYRDPTPRSEHDEFLESAKRLHDTLTAPFERPFEAFGYTAEFTFTPSSNHTVFATDGIWETIGSATEKQPATKEAWSIKLGYDPKTERLVTTKVSIPVVSTAIDEKLILQRIETGEYLLLHRADETSEPKLFATESDEFEKEIFKRNSAVSFSESYVDRLLINAGYLSPELFTTPDDLQVHVASTLDTATQWHRKETIVTPIDDATSVTLERTAAMLPSSQFEESTEEYVRQTDGHVTATVNYHNSDSRGQLLIRFAYADHFVSMPEVTSRKVVRAFDDAVIADHGPDAYQIVDSKPLDLTAEQMDALAEELTTTL